MDDDAKRRRRRRIENYRREESITYAWSEVEGMRESLIGICKGKRKNWGGEMRGKGRKKKGDGVLDLWRSRTIELWPSDGRDFEDGVSEQRECLEIAYRNSRNNIFPMASSCSSFQSFLWRFSVSDQFLLQSTLCFFPHNF